MLALLTNLYLPALYIALLLFIRESSQPICSSILQVELNVPFPVVIEAFLMEASLELLREAGVRLPGPIGATIGIVGGLVLGQLQSRRHCESADGDCGCADGHGPYSSPSYSFAISDAPFCFDGR